MDQRTAGPSHGRNSSSSSRFLSRPVYAPEKALQGFLKQVRTKARNFLPKEQQKFPIAMPFCEVEARLGILKVPHASPARRVTSCGAKKDTNNNNSGHVIPAFDCSQHKVQMESGVSRTNFSKWAGGFSGISEVSPLTKALGVSHSSSGDLKRDLVEKSCTETVYGGYADERRVCYPGVHKLTGLAAAAEPQQGKMEAKERLCAPMDLTIPSAPYDIRISLASEKTLGGPIGDQPPPNWTMQRIKRRCSYTRRDNTIAWQIDVTEVTTTTRQITTNQSSLSSNSAMSLPHVDYEIEFELQASALLKLINEENENNVNTLAQRYAQQLWWILSQINPLTDALDVEEFLRDHPNKTAVTLALAQCGAMRRFMDPHHHHRSFESPIATPGKPPPASLANVKFTGCMPVNFQRHNIEDIQRSPSNAYFMSEKTDGVRHFLIFTGDTAVLVDRAMRGKQPIPIGDDKKDPFHSILPLIKPGTVFDGEVVMNRRGRKPRPIFIVFDVMAISVTELVLHLPFEKRLEHLRRATFRTPTANRDMFDARAVADMSIPLPLVRKNFVKRTEVDELLSHVVEERGMRTYRNGDLHNHLTDGIIFQPNLPYVCGTDVNLLKWKYLDTVTIDVELLPLLPSDDDDTLRVACLGEEQTRVDMTRHIHLPKSERMKLEADRFESGTRIAEVGFDPETGEWYYLTMRADKITPNHISTVMGTLLELAECLTTEELRYRMSVPAGSRDTYRKDVRRMLGQLLSFKRDQLKGKQKPAAR